MKKMIVVICILFTIFLGLFFYTKNQKKNKEITIQEIEEIQIYLNKIYMMKELTNEALPKFEQINSAPTKWIWEVVKKNIDNYDTIKKEEITKKAEEIFGEELKKEIPKDNVFIYNEENQTYELTNSQYDNSNDTFLINKIEKQKNKYNVEIIEYIEDYSEEKEEEFDIIIKNTKEQEILRIKNTQGNEKIIEEVKNNIEKFNKKNIQLEKTSNGIICKKVQ